MANDGPIKAPEIREQTEYEAIEGSMTHRPKKGELITEVMLGYEEVPIYYGGTEPKSGSDVIVIGEEDACLLPKGEQATPSYCRIMMADRYGMDLYMIETAGGRVFYEACNDMPEKRELYRELEAKVTLEHRRGGSLRMKKDAGC